MSRLPPPFLSVLVLAPLLLTAATPKADLSPGWTARYDGPAHRYDYPFAVASSPDGSRIFVTGSSEGAPYDEDLVTVGYDATTGQELWTARFEGTGGAADGGLAVVVSPDGAHVYVTGYASGTDNPDGGFAAYDIATISYDTATGEQAWSALFASPAGEFDISRAIATSPDGAWIFVSGGSSLSFGDLDFITIAYEASSGVAVWTSMYRGPGRGWDEAGKMALTPSGDRVVVTGPSTTGPGTESDYATVAYQAVTGAEVWASRYEGPGGGLDRPADVEISRDGAVAYVTGVSDGGEANLDFATALYRVTDGREIRVARYGNPFPGGDYASALALDPQGNQVYVTGSTWGGSAFDATTLAYDSRLVRIRWRAQLDPPGDGGQVPVDLAVTPDGRAVYVLNSSERAFGGPDDFLLTAFGSDTGRLIDHLRYDGPANADDLPFAMTMAPDGSRVYLAGASHGGDSTLFDYATLAHPIPAAL